MAKFPRNPTAKIYRQILKTQHRSAIDELQSRQEEIYSRTRDRHSRLFILGGTEIQECR